jgi:autophagy-related protein 2
MVNVGSGVVDLVLVPVSQYKRDGRILRGLQKGAKNFAKCGARARKWPWPAARPVP